MAACRFEPHIATLEMPTLASQPFGEIVPEDTGSPETPEEAVERLLDELFDPFNMPLDRPYEGTVYQEMDRIVAGAYAYYGYDLAALAAAGEENPLTEDMFEAYLQAQGLEYILDPASGEEVSVLAWLRQTAAGGGVEGPYALVLRQINEDIDTSNPMNFERNYLAAMLDAHSRDVERARQAFLEDLIEVFGSDAAAIYEALLTIHSPGGE